MSRAVVDDWFAAFREKDTSKLRLADDFVHASPFGEIHGARAYRELVEENADAFFGASIDIEVVLECGGKYAVRYLVNGSPACDCFEVRDGQIARIYSYYHVGNPPPQYDEWD